MCEQGRMSEQSELTKWRSSKGWTLDEAASQFGIKSKGYLSEIERGGRCSVAVALEIERVTEGAIPASSLNPDIALIDKARAA
jgi:transcriptional regulator with XRE-family HTH domain